MAKKDYLDALFAMADQIEEHTKKNERGVSSESMVTETMPPESIARETMLSESMVCQTRDGKNTSEHGLPPSDGIQVGRYHIRVDQNVFDELLPRLSPYEQLVYLRLYRLSWGFKRNYCEVGYTALARATNTSFSTIRRAISSLIDQGFIQVLETGAGKAANKYLVRLPHEVLALDTQTEVCGVSPESMVTESMVTETHGMVTKNMVRESIPGQKALDDEVSTIMSSGTMLSENTNTILNNNKNNNIPDDVVDKLKMLGVNEKSIEKWANKYGVDEIRHKLDVYEYIAATREDRIDNPPGWLARALEEDYDFPEDYYKKKSREFGEQIAKEAKKRQQ